MGKGKLIIISAPSGCGKSTIISHIINDPELRLSFSVSATTRQPRTGEVNGKDYYFLTQEEFNDAIAENALVEYQEVYAGRFYGTLRSEVERIQSDGKNVVLDIDVKGGVNVKREYGNNALSIFIKPPSIETLRQRLVNRGTDTEEAINQRVAKASLELTYAEKYDAVVVNDVLEEAVARTRKLILEFTNN
ncbi:MAG: guanylate kinase [Muribaculaceae bacterium]|jgi:guanylate kinase|nr:guanylate kinase [Muribaculaceae bacterium]